MTKACDFKAQGKFNHLMLIITGMATIQDCHSYSISKQNSLKWFSVHKRPVGSNRLATMTKACDFKAQGKERFMSVTQMSA